MPATWHDRYDNAKPSYTKVNNKKFADLDAGTSVLIPSPADIEQEISQLKRSETINLGALRSRLAETHGADGTCPVMCGMHLRVVAEVTLDALDAGVPPDSVAPVWNAIDPTSSLAQKLPGGRARIEWLRDMTAAGQLRSRSAGGR